MHGIILLPDGKSCDKNIDHLEIEKNRRDIVIAKYLTVTLLWT